LRRRVGRREGDVARHVVPVVTTGLHCGVEASVQASEGVAPGRPRRHDGAPLRPPQPRPLARRSRRRPRRHDGAPLRRRPGTASQRRGCPVVPVVTTGLHCGTVLPTYFVEMAEGVVPVVTTGLHCGRNDMEKTDAALYKSSPSSRRGSIAAGSGRPTCPLGPGGSSPSSRRGSIAARDGEVGRNGRKAGRPRRHDGAPLRRGWRP